MTSLNVKGQWYPLGLTVDDTTGLVLTVEGLSGEDAATLEEWIEPIAEAVGAEILVTDDADAFKTVADNLGRDHQVCKSHVKRNTESLMENLQSAVAIDVDGSLAALGLTPVTQARSSSSVAARLIQQRANACRRSARRAWTTCADAWRGCLRRSPIPTSDSE